jgi:hypothetical protein
METLVHNLPNLFRQLGLPSEPSEIDAFVGCHQLETGVSLCQAAFWSPAQARLLREAIKQDADWTAAVDQLALRLG